MRRFLRALALGCVLGGFAGPAAAAEPTGVLVGLVSLPLTWVSAILLASGIALVALELHLPTHGILGIAGVLAFMLGGFLLVAPPATAAPFLTALEANAWLLLGLGLLLAAYCGLVMRAGLRARRLPIFDPFVGLPGALGVATSTLAPSGAVLIRHERWSAMTDGEPIQPGDEVEVIAREGLQLLVRRLTPTGATRFETLPSQGEVRPGIRVERTG